MIITTNFDRLMEQALTDALEESSRPLPLTIATAIAELKRYVPDPTKRLRLRELVVGEASRVRQAIDDSNFRVDVAVDAAYARDRAARYEGISETLVALMAAGGTWTDDARPFAEALELVGNPSNMWGGNPFLTTFRRYPALLCFYAAGVAATSAGRWEILRALSYDPIVVDLDGRLPAAAGLHQWKVFGDPDGGKCLPGMEEKLAPVSSYLYDILREPLRDTIAVDARYAEAFDRFEYLLGLIIVDQEDQDLARWRAPVGRIGWRYRESDGRAIDPVERIPAEAATAGDDWGPLVAGLFGGDAGRLKQAIDGYNVVVHHIRKEWSRR